MVCKYCTDPYSTVRISSTLHITSLPTDCPLFGVQTHRCSDGRDPELAAQLLDFLVALADQVVLQWQRGERGDRRKGKGEEESGEWRVGREEAHVQFEMLCRYRTGS